MPFPSAPWTLTGHAVLSLQVVDSALARAFVPPALRVVSVVPGKTLAAVYAGHYGPGSVLEYNELIVAPALTRLGARYGFWISHIYVDNPDSMAGGREIWGLPKELAEFTWQEGAAGRVMVRQGARTLCSLDFGTGRRLWRQAIFLPCLTSLDSDLLAFTAKWSSRFSLERVTLDVPDGSPFAALGLGKHGLSYQHSAMRLVAGPPSLAGHTATPLRLTRPAEEPARQPEAAATLAKPPLAG